MSIPCYFDVDYAFTFKLKFQCFGLGLDFHFHYLLVSYVDYMFGTCSIQLLLSSTYQFEF